MPKQSEINCWCLKPNSQIATACGIFECVISTLMVLIINHVKCVPEVAVSRPRPILYAIVARDDSHACAPGRRRAADWRGFFPGFVRPLVGHR